MTISSKLVETAINENLCDPAQIPKTVRALTQILDAHIERLLNIASGCHDYGGGYSKPREIEIYHHGIQTVINALEASDDDSLQTRVLENIGRHKE